MVEYRRFAIRGYLDEPVLNQFVRQEAEADELGVLLPGLHYTCDMPLFYYSEPLLVNAGADVLRMEYDYRHLDLKNAIEAEFRQRLFADTEAALRFCSKHRPYRRVTLIGKSLGTLAMGHLLHKDLFSAMSRAVWLTPLLRDDWLRARMLNYEGPSAVVIGSDDRHYDPQLLGSFSRMSSYRTTVIEGAEHSIDIDGDVGASVEAVGRAMSDLQAFLAT